MTFDEAFASELGFRPGGEVSLSGHLTVCHLFAYLSEHPIARFDDPPGRCILIADAGVASALSNAGCAVAVGSMVIFSGRAIVSGRLFRSGLGIFPIAFSGRYEMRYIDDDDVEYIIKKSG